MVGLICIGIGENPLEALGAVWAQYGDRLANGIDRLEI